jgi:hypothetical protein
MTEPYGPSTPTDPGDEPVPASPPEPPTPITPVAPPVRKRPGRLLLRLAAVVVVVVVGVIAYLVFFQKSDPTAAKVGDCVSITGSDYAATATRIPCDDQSALYVVTASGRTVTCDAYEVSYTGSNRDRTKMCLFYNVAVGDCLKVTQNGDGDAKGACAAGMLKVVSVRTDTSAASACPTQSDAARVDATRNRLICFVTVT